MTDPAMLDPDRARHRVEHLLVDSIVAAGEGATMAEDDREALHTVMADVGQAVAVRIDERGDVQVDVTPFVYASLNLMSWLIDTLADHAHVTRFDVITDLRQAVRDWEAD